MNDWTNELTKTININRPLFSLKTFNANISCIGVQSPSVTRKNVEKKRLIATHYSFVRWFVAFSWLIFLQAPPFPAVVADPKNHVVPSSVMHLVCTWIAVEAPQCGMVLHCICTLFFDYHCHRLHLSLKPLSMIRLRVLFALWRNNNAIVMRFCRQWLLNYRYPTVTLPEWKATNETFRSERVYFEFDKYFFALTTWTLIHATFLFQIASSTRFNHIIVPKQRCVMIRD